MVQKPIYEVIKRFFDIVNALLALIVFGLPMLCISLIIKLTSKGPAMHWSSRIGYHNTIFKMAKYRTMRIDTPQVATHLLSNPDVYITPVGKLLRKFSLDELPQLINILRGDLSVVGPRPALYNQDNLKSLRTEKNIHLLKPGLSGWAQVNGRDELPIPVKVGFDEEYLNKRSFLFDCRIVVLTLFKAIRGEGVTH